MRMHPNPTEEETMAQEGGWPFGPLTPMGRKTTHVSNAYHKTIWATVIPDKDSETVTKKIQADVAAYGVKGGLTYDAVQTLSVKHGLTRIAPKQPLPFNPDARKMVYITIFTEDGKIVCTNHPLSRDYSVFVDKHGHLRHATHGELWK